MKTRISTVALALGMVSGAATAGPLADLLGNITGGSLTNTLVSGYNNQQNPFLGFTGPLNSNSALAGIAAFETSGRGNGQLIGVGAGNEGSTGNGGILAGLAVLSGDNSGNGGLVGVSALSDGGNSGQGGLVGVELLNGDTVLGLNSAQFTAATGQEGLDIPNPSGLSATELGNTLRPALQDALQRGGQISDPLENQLLAGLDVLVDPVTEGVDGLVNTLGTGVADSPLGENAAGTPLEGLGTGLGDLVSVVSTGDVTTGNDIAADIRNGNNAGNGDVAGVSAFSDDNGGGSGVAAVSAISGSGNSENGDANISVANADNRSKGLLDIGIANGSAGDTGNPCPTGNCGRPEPPIDTPNLLVTNGKAEENCGSGSEHNETGLKGAGQLTQFNSRNAREQGCNDTRLQQLSASL